jgi:hypothetical protein
METTQQSPQETEKKEIEKGAENINQDFAEFKPKRFQLLSDVWSFMKVRKKWWLLPIVVLLILVGTLIVVGQSSALSPFIYALF